MKTYKKCQETLEKARTGKDDALYIKAIKYLEKAYEKEPAADNIKELLAQAYLEYGEVLKEQGRLKKMFEAFKCYQKAQKLVHSEATSKLQELKSQSSLQKLEFFTQNPRKVVSLTNEASALDYLKKEGYVENTQNLVMCLQRTDDTHEIERLQKLAKQVIEIFSRKKIKCKEDVHEVVALAPIFDETIYQSLLSAIINAIGDNSQEVLLNQQVVGGLAEVIRNVAKSTYLKVNDLKTILEKLYSVLETLQPTDLNNVYKLTCTIAQVLDAMVAVGVEGLSREKLHEPLRNKLKRLSKNKDLRIAYQSTYALQALAYIPNDESPLQEILRRTLQVSSGILTLASAVKDMDPGKLPTGIKNLSDGLDFMKVVIDVLESLKAAVEEEQAGVYDIIRGFDQMKKCTWYLALQYTAFLIQEQELKGLDQFIQEVPCRTNKYFLCGLCAQLEQLAMMQTQKSTWKSIIEFLGNLYQDDKRWGKHKRVNRWVLMILSSLKKSTDKTLQEAAREKLNQLEKITDKKDLHDKYVSESCFLPSAQVVKPRFPNDLLIEAREVPLVAIEEKIARMKAKHLYDNKELERLYVPLRGKLTFQMSDNFRLNNQITDTFNLKDKFDEFLNSEKKVLLLLGDSGAGKSTFNKYLTRELWKNYNKEEHIPLFISLPHVEGPTFNLIFKFLKTKGFSEDQIEILKMRKFVFILDGYDEIKGSQNLYNMNKLDDWKAKIVISCRTEYLGEGRSNFLPNGDTKFFQEIMIVPFSKNEIDQYVEKYINHIKKTKYEVEYSIKTYESTLNHIPNLKELVSNPFLLWIMMEGLPILITEQGKECLLKVSRLELYEIFVNKWFKYAKERLESRRQLTDTEKGILEDLKKDFTQYSFEFTQKLAVKLYKMPEYNGILDYSTFFSKNTWKTFFGNNTEIERQKVNLLLESCPLKCYNNQYQFIHQSILEYFVTRAIFEATIMEDTSTEKENIQNAYALITQKNLVDDTAVIHFLAEYVHLADLLVFKAKLQEFLKTDDISTYAVVNNLLMEYKQPKKAIAFKVLLKDFVKSLKINNDLLVRYKKIEKAFVFKTKLQDFIENSKKEGGKIAAANAITILVKAGMQFNGTDLNGVQISGADLSYGVFDHAQLQEADLCKVNFQGAWLRGTDLRGAHLKDVKLGAQTIDIDGPVQACCHSKDGQWLAIAGKMSITIYYTKTLKEFRRYLTGHKIKSISFSPNSELLASGSEDAIVHLWSVIALTQDPLYIWNKHTDIVCSVMFSPDGKLLASGSYDRTVRLWEIPTFTKNSLYILKHDNPVYSVTFSPDGKLASASGSLVYLWLITASTQDILCIRNDHTNKVCDVTFSSDGKLLASGSSDCTVRLWSVAKDLLHIHYTWSKHTHEVNSISFSSDDELLASCSNKTVRLWSVIQQTEDPLYIMEEQTFTVKSVMFFPFDKLLACSIDGIIRLWDISQFFCISKGHTDGIKSVAFSPNGKLLASASDKTIKLWAIDTLQPFDILKGNINMVKCIMFLPNGKLLSNNMDGTIQLWEVGISQPQNILKKYNANNVACSPDGKYLALGTNNTVLLWTVDQLKLIDTLKYDNLVWSIAFSPDSKLLASGLRNGKVQLWTVGQPHHFQTLTLKSTWECNMVNIIVFSPDGQHLAACCNDNVVQLWAVNAIDINLPKYLNGHTFSVACIAFSPNGKLLTSGSWDCTVRLWEVISGQCLATIQGFYGYVYTIAWQHTFEGDYLLTGSADKAVRLWQVKHESEICQVTLHWTSTQAALIATEAHIQNVVDLSPTNLHLLKQLGAVENY